MKKQESVRGYWIDGCRRAAASVNACCDGCAGMAHRCAHRDTTLASVAVFLAYKTRKVGSDVARFSLPARAGIFVEACGTPDFK